MSLEHQKWGPILLIGGSGRLGYFVAKRLLQEPEIGQLISINRSHSVAHPCQGVDYRRADLRDDACITRLMHAAKPETIINVAAPAHANTLTPKAEFEDVIVKSQRRLLELAREVGTKYFISTTSANVAEGYEHVNIDETAPSWPEDSSAFAYWVQRARAERHLIAADSASLQTISLRLPMIIGERDYAFVPAMIKSLDQGKTSVQIGQDAGLLATVSAEDAGRAHVLALLALMKPGNKAHGEAFYIIGKTPMSFWSMARFVWSQAGWKQERPSLIIPQWMAWIIAAVTETVMRPFGMEPQLSTHVLRFMCNTWTYNGAKARDLLSYVPEEDTKDQLAQSVKWHLQNP